MTRSEGLEVLKNHLSKPQHTILIGARQVGKTTLVRQLIEVLQQQNEAVYFLTFEDPAILRSIDEHPEQIFDYTVLLDSLPEGRKLYLVIDEVQYAANPSNFLKLLYDKYAGKVKIIATGSSAFYIDKNFKDSLAGRKQVFELYPLHFGEFLHFKEREDLVKEWQEMHARINYKSLKQKEIDRYFEEYMIYGGYPAIALADTEQEKQTLLRELVNSYMKKDALEAGIREELKFFQLARILADQAGNLVNHHELSKTLQMSANTISNYVYLLQKSFIIHLLPPKFGNLRKELTKMPKVFFNDNGLRNALVNNFSKTADRADKGTLLENYVFTRLRNIHGTDLLRYWRTADGNEVDFVVEQTLHEGMAYEVKYDEAEFKPSAYKKFREEYPGFSFSVISQRIKEKAIQVERL
jgi:predicted AAA+ superfamily ATPase